MRTGTRCGAFAAACAVAILWLPTAAGGLHAKGASGAAVQDAVPGQATPKEQGRIPPPAPADVHRHLDRLEQIVDSLLAVAPTGEPIAAEEERAAEAPARVGTAGTTVTPRTGETLVIERAKLEELRVHLRQAREALRQVERQKR